MNWNTLPTSTKLLEGTIVAVGFVWGLYKKEVQDFLRDCFKRAYKWCFVREPARRIPDAELSKVLALRLEDLMTLLYMLEREYSCDRVSVTSYEQQDDGSALATCVAEVRKAEMKSVQHLQRTPISAELWRQVQRITALENRVRCVKDARVEENAVLKAALLNSSVVTAYYQAMYDPAEEYKKITLLSLSWHTPHEFFPEQLQVLLLSGKACAGLLSTMEWMKKISTT